MTNCITVDIVMEIFAKKQCPLDFFSVAQFPFLFLFFYYFLKLKLDLAALLLRQPEVHRVASG